MILFGKENMFKSRQIVIFLTFFLSGLFLTRYSFAQNFDIKPGQFKFLQSDSSNFYFKEVWIPSKDINLNDAQGFSRRAFDKINMGYYKEALANIDKSIKLDPALGVNYYLKGYVMLRQNSLYPALDNFRKAIALKDTNIYTYFYSAQVCMALGKGKEADSLFTCAILKNNNFADAYFGLGNLNLLMNQWDKAEINYKKVIELTPKFVLAYYNLAIIYLRKNPFNSLKYLDKCIEVNPRFAQAYYLRGYIYLSMERIPPGLKNLDKAIEAEPSNRFYKISKAQAYMFNKQYSEAIDEISSAFEIQKTLKYVRNFLNTSKDQLFNDFLNQVVTLVTFPGNLPEIEMRNLKFALCEFLKRYHPHAEGIYSDLSKSASFPGLVNYFRGINLKYLKQSDKALRCFSDVELAKTFPYEVYLQKGILLNNMGRYRDAIANLNIYINKKDSIKAAFLNRAIAYVKIWESDSAVLDFNKCQKLDSTDIDVYYNRALCYKKWEKYDKAIEDLNVVIDLTNGSVEPSCLLAECCYLKGDTAGAYNILNTTSERFNFLDENGYFIRGTINLAYKKYDSAILDFNNVIGRNNRNTDAFVYRGLAYYCREQFDKAKADFTEAINLDQNNLTAFYTRGLANIKLKIQAEAYLDLKKAESLGHPLAKRAILLYLKDYKPQSPQKTPVF